MKKLTVTLLLITLPAINCFGYGSPGHRMIGRVADKRLAGTTTATKISTLLKGMTLARAATIPDEIKDLDQGGTFTLPAEFATIETQLKKFWAANKPSTSHFYHRNFHFTDVPVVGNEHYKPGVVGRSDVDIVHMINFCLGVLKGDIAETNPRKITKPVAIILLAHYVGDIHQPLHVGAQYFTAQGQIFEPGENNEGFDDRGGNQLTLKLLNGTLQVNAGAFHIYWDNTPVANARVRISKKIQAQTHQPVDPNSDKVETFLAQNEPANWKLQTPVGDWAEAWVNDILPMAREAHERLTFDHITFTPNSKTIKGGDAIEKSPADGVAYKVWAAQSVEQEVQKAGWRLAALLSEALKNQP